MQPDARRLELVWPDIEELAPFGDPVANDAGDMITAVGMLGPEGTFFDIAAIHILTTATLACLRSLYPTGVFNVRRFRPNLVVATDDDNPGPSRTNGSAERCGLAKGSG